MLKRFFRLSLCAAVLNLAMPFGFAGAAQYKYDPPRSCVLFTVKNLGIVTVAGRFQSFSGMFDFDPKNIEAGRVNLLIQTASLNAGNEMKDKSLRSKNLFWCEKFPDITFVSQKFSDVEGGRFNIYGLLTIRGKSVPVVFQTKMLTKPAEVRPNEPVRFTTETYINRKDFDLGTGGLMNPVITLTGETLRISLEVEGIPLSS